MFKIGPDQDELIMNFYLHDTDVPMEQCYNFGIVLVRWQVADINACLSLSLPRDIKLVILNIIYRAYIYLSLKFLKRIVRLLPEIKHALGLDTLFVNFIRLGLYHD